MLPDNNFKESLGSMGIHPVDPVGLAQDEMREWSENRDHNTFYGHYWLI